MQSFGQHLKHYRGIGYQSWHVPAAHWWLSGNVKLGLIWGSVVLCDVFVLVCCAFCMLGNVHLLFLEVLDTHLVKVQGGGTFFGDGSFD